MKNLRDYNNYRTQEENLIVNLTPNSKLIVQNFKNIWIIQKKLQMTKESLQMIKDLKLNLKSLSKNNQHFSQRKMQEPKSYQLFHVSIQKVVSHVVVEIQKFNITE
jgi:hypothetical protein